MLCRVYASRCFRTVGVIILGCQEITVGLGLTIKLLCTTPPTTETQCQEYLSCYWPDVDETLQVGSWEQLEQIPTLKVGSCEHLEQIPTARVTFVHATFVLVTFVHIRNMSVVTDLISMKLWMGTSRTDSSYQVDICPGNICSGDICTYKEYLSCYWHDLD